MRGIRGWTRVGILLVICAATASCTTLSQGRGSVIGSPASTGVSSLPSEPVTSTPPTSSPPGAPSAASAPAACPGGTCRQVLSSSLISPYSVIVRANSAYGGGAGATIVELTASGVAVSWTVRPGESPAQISCQSSPDRSNCVLVDNVGAHGSTATVLRLAGGTLAVGSSVVATTPQMQATDVNHDGWVDAIGLQNTLKPDYATGTVYWQTWTSNGTQLTSTGCTPPTHTPPSPPSAPLLGQCP
jgi:hypothetical protein